MNRAPQTILVRLDEGELVGPVSRAFAEKLLASGAAQSVGKERTRYLRLKAGIVIEKSSLGWEVLEKERRKYGDDAVRRGAIAWDHQPLRWQPPQ